MFDQEMVAVGSDIGLSESLSVETIVENRRLNEPGTNRLIVNGQAGEVIHADYRIEVLQLSPTVQLHVHTKDAHGRAATIRLKLR